MAISFDRYGNPVPAELIPVSVAEVEEAFLTAFPHSTTRKAIMDGWMAYNRDLAALLSSEWEQWLDGSFITLKPNPNDIDVVNFIAGDLPSGCYEKLYPFTYPDSLEKYCVDAYFIRVYPPGSSMHNIVTKKGYDYWLGQFGQDREERPKAILTLVWI